MAARKRRRFGSVRKLPSGRFQASYVNPHGQRETAPITFIRARDAEVWLAQVEADISRGAWVGRQASDVVLEDYAKEYLQRPTIGDSWRRTCTDNLKLHMDDLRLLPLDAITSRRVRQWHDKVLTEKHGKVVVAQSYRFLRAVMNQAVRDELILKNPCNIPGAGADQSRERDIATVDDLENVLKVIPERYRAAVLIAAWCSLRRSEVVGLRVEDVDIEGRMLHVRKAKTPTGIRTVAVPDYLVPYLTEARQWSDGTWFFTSPLGGQMKGGSFYQAYKRARDRIGLDGITLHDLRHTGNTMAAAVGATTKDLMRRLGHASEAAARRYLHAVDGRDEEIAKELSRLARGGNPAKLPKRLQ